MVIESVSCLSGACGVGKCCSYTFAADEWFNGFFETVVDLVAQVRQVMVTGTMVEVPLLPSGAVQVTYTLPLEPREDSLVVSVVVPSFMPVGPAGTVLVVKCHV